MVLVLLLGDFALQVPFFAYRFIENNLPALKRRSVQIFDGFKGKVSVGEFDKGKPSTAFFIRVLRDVNVKDLSEGREKSAQMSFVDVKYKISDNDSIVFDFFGLLFFWCVICNFWCFICSDVIERLRLLFFVFELFVFDLIALLFWEVGTFVLEV
jgi:hypothetical protein